MEFDKSLSDWEMPKNGHEDSLIDMFKIKGDVFIDVGAHLGTWTLRLAPYFNSILAFEPNPKTANSLEKNLYLNQITNVEIYMIALSDLSSHGQSINLNLFESAGHATLLDAHPYPEQVKNNNESIVINAMALDYCYSSVIIQRRKIDLIKIDVEGAEDKVLEGAIHTLKRHKPNMIIEIHGKDQMRKCTELLESISMKPKVMQWSTQDYLVVKHD